MEILFERKSRQTPSVSIVLLDWSCRESFHILEYLAAQTVSRGLYEIIWVEYYDRRADGIKSRLDESLRGSGDPVLDKWIVLDIPAGIHYHKHLMYNVGIVASSGRIVTICDSDAMVKPTFVESIIKAFEEDEEIVLHMDEVRNNSKSFYPFNHPSFEEILGKGCINWTGEATTGLTCGEDPLHTRNYGACMCALRSALIEIGGADEHTDYLGHVCGPYELTFRLINSGRREVWHKTEYLYHLWHPGTEGKGNYTGPHDGKNMSTTALEAISTGRVFPLVENTAVRVLRLKDEEVLYRPLLERAVPAALDEWSGARLKNSAGLMRRVKEFSSRPVLSIGMYVIFCRLLKKQLHMKAVKFSREPHSIKDLLKKALKTYGFLKRMSMYNNFIIRRCTNCMERLAEQNIHRVALFGQNDVEEIFYRLTLNGPVEVEAVFGYMDEKDFHGLRVRPLNAVTDYRGKIVVAAIASESEMTGKLKEMGVDPERIVLL